jgi:FtsZ-binding cell division protein ZapB
MSEALVTLAHEIEELTERNNRLSASFDTYKLSYELTRTENIRLRAENDKLNIRVLDIERKYVRVTAALTSAGESILAAKENIETKKDEPTIPFAPRTRTGRDHPAFSNGN